MYTQPTILVILIKSLDIHFIPFSLDSVISPWLALWPQHFPIFKGSDSDSWFHLTCRSQADSPVTCAVCCRFGPLSDCIPALPGLKSAWPSAANVHSRSKAKSTESNQTRRGNWRWSRRNYCLPLIVLLFFQMKQNTGILGGIFFPFLTCV